MPGGDAENISGRLQELRLRRSASPSSERLGLGSLRDALLDAQAASAALPRSQTPLLVPSGGPSARPGGQRRRSSSVNARPYDVADEEPPQDRFHDPAFQQAFADARSLMAQLADVLGSGTLHLEPDSVMRGLREKAGGLARFQCPPTRTVGLVGDSGVGMGSPVLQCTWLLGSDRADHALFVSGQARAAC